ncbi:MAG: phosphomannomutase/phosphoglucomutase [Candidatus Latescibacteria bacterium]|nr:phosphomannomutase/phosphoglucomutase [Candidatus Latescibacterota bacterium]
MQVDPTIFKAYDIRGIYPEQIDAPTAKAIGRAFATFLQANSVIVGRDMRLAGPVIAQALIDGLTQQGADVVDIGQVSTDQYYHICATLGQAGVMVTASHNPPEYIGFKMVRSMPYLLSGDEGIQDLRRLVETDTFPTPLRTGQVGSQDLSQGFIDKLLSLVDNDSLKPLKVVADPGNGMVGPILERVYRHLPIDLIGMYLEPDGRAPNRGFDPMQPENHRALQERVLAEGADVGFAFDGDGDRFFVVDDRGHFVPGDFLTALMSRYLLERHPGAPIIYDVRCSWAVPDTIAAAGGHPLIERVGHAFIKTRLAAEQAVFAGELSGHYYFRDFYGADSGLVPSLIVLEMLSRIGEPFSALLAPYEEKYFTSGEINSRVDDPAARITALEQRYGDGRIDRLDGISVTFDDWHFNVRSSNTEPLLRLNLEARNKTQMEERRDEVLAFICS